MEDLPLPEAPMIVRKRVVVSRPTIFATSVSRPKKRSASFSSKYCNPKNGGSPGSGGRFSISLTSSLLTTVDLMLTTAPRKSPESLMLSPEDALRLLARDFLGELNLSGITHLV